MTEIQSYFPKDHLAYYGQDRAACEKRILKASDILMQLTEGLDEATLGKPLAPGKWTVHELISHLVLAYSFFAQIAEDFASTASVTDMGRGQLSGEGRPLSPFKETATLRELATLLSDYRKHEKRFLVQCRNLEEAGKLHEVCVIQSFLGELSVLETMQNAAWHIRHHSKQIEKALA